MADPVSWLLIEPGWRVVSADGTDVGRIEEVTGDSSHDIFDGLAIAFSALGRQHYVPAEQVGTITDGVVQLQLDAAGVAKLADFDEPAEEEQIEPEKAPLTTRARELERKPTFDKRSEPVPLLRRVLEWFGLAGKR
ncbi:MAG TPA: DUF2171 domain-containing protein [Gaiellaceae bacterium]